MVPGTIVAVSRNPGDRLEDLRRVWPRRAPLVSGRRRRRRPRPQWLAVRPFGSDFRRSRASTAQPSPAVRWATSDMTDADVTTMLGRNSTPHDAAGLSLTKSAFVLFSSISGYGSARWLALSSPRRQVCWGVAFAYRPQPGSLPRSSAGAVKSLADREARRRSGDGERRAQTVPGGRVCHPRVADGDGRRSPGSQRRLSTRTRPLLAWRATRGQCASSTTSWRGGTRRCRQGRGRGFGPRTFAAAARRNACREMLADRHRRSRRRGGGHCPPKRLDPRPDSSSSADSLMSVTLAPAQRQPGRSPARCADLRISDHLAHQALL